MLMGIFQKNFLETVNYSSCNEDWRTEWQALRLGPKDRVLCVTGSGDRPLDLLMEDPAEIVALDLNPAQTRLLNQKISLLCGSNDSDFLKAMERLLYAGRFERYYRGVSILAQMLRGGVIHRLLKCETLEEQRQIVRERWDRPWWRGTFRMLCSRWVSKTFLGDPAFFQNAPREWVIGDYIYERILKGLDTWLARESFMFSLIFCGRLAPGDLPPYLDPKTLPLIRERVGRLRPMTANLIEHLEQVAPGSYSAFSLSDVPSYLDQQLFERLLRAMARAAAPGARFCIRLFLTDQVWPDWAADLGFVREPELEKNLEAEDRGIFYRFRVGYLEKRV